MQVSKPNTIPKVKWKQPAQAADTICSGPKITTNINWQSAA